MTQFPEHEHGKRSADGKVNKLDKLARHLGVLIHIDGVPYGSLESKAAIDLSTPVIDLPQKTVIYSSPDLIPENPPNLEVDGEIVVKVGQLTHITDMNQNDLEDRQILMELAEEINEAEMEEKLEPVIIPVIRNVDEEILTRIELEEPAAPKKPAKKTASKKEKEADKEE